MSVLPRECICHSKDEIYAQPVICLSALECCVCTNTFAFFLISLVVLTF